MVPLGALSYAGASVGIAIFLALSGLYRHKKHPDGIYGYSPPAVYLFLVLALICIIFSSVLLLLDYLGTWQVDVAFYGAALGCMLISLYLKYAKIIINDTSIKYVGLLTHEIYFRDIVKIIEYGQIRRIHADIHTAKWTKQMSISGFIADFDDLIANLRDRCPSAEYIRKMN